jgi:hypothetical protein
MPNCSFKRTAVTGLRYYQAVCGSRRLTQALAPSFGINIMGSRPLQKYEGSCHCGAVRFEVETDFPELTMCDCSICRKKNALMVKVHESQFKLLAGEESLTEYQFHTKTARHFFCKVCGIYPFHRKRVTPVNLGINVFCLQGFEPRGIPVRQAAGASMP